VLVVVVDTSTPAVTAALALVDPNAVGAKGVELIGERRTVDARAHGELLAPAITAVLADAGASGRDLAALVAGVGPGPFTGLRVGLMTAAAMGQALAIPTYGVCSLDGLGAATVGTALVATDARRKEVYWAVYRDGVRLTGPSVNRPDAVAALLGGSGVEYAVGDGALLYPTALPVPVRDEPRYPPSVALAGLAADRVRGRAPGEVLTPLYLRRPDAVEPGQRKAVTP
jgi:tRNA threonylcarbamoyladenosine biosynthesis protein TsaB